MKLNPTVNIPFKREGDAMALSGQVTLDNLSPSRTYYDSTSGTIGITPPNTQRFETMTDGETGLLVEGGSTNIVLNSNYVTFLGNITGVNGASTLSPSLSPIGDSAARFEYRDVLPINGAVDTRTIEGFNSVLFTYANPPAVSNSSTASFWANIPLGKTISVSIEDIVPTVYNDSTIVYVGTGKYKRYSIPLNGNIPAGTQLRFLFHWDVGQWANGEFFDAACFQIEPLDIMSSYIPTTSVPVTRLPDNHWIHASGNYSPNSYTFDVEFEPLAKSNILNYYIFDTDSGSVNDRVAATTLGTNQLSLYYGSVNLVEYNHNITRLSMGSDFNAHINGHPILRNATFVNYNLLGQTRVMIGSDYLNSAQLYGHIRNFKIYNRALTTEEINNA